MIYFTFSVVILLTNSLWLLQGRTNSRRFDALCQLYRNQIETQNKTIDGLMNRVMSHSWTEYAQLQNESQPSSSPEVYDPYQEYEKEIEEGEVLVEYSRDELTHLGILG